jgi:hypothetical protein
MFCKVLGWSSDALQFSSRSFTVGEFHSCSFSAVSHSWSHCLFLYLLPVLLKDTGVYAAFLPWRWRKIIFVLSNAIFTASYCTYQKLQLISRKKKKHATFQMTWGTAFVYKIELFRTESVFVEIMLRKNKLVWLLIYNYCCVVYKWQHVKEGML